MASIDNQAAPEQNVPTLTMNEALDAQANGELPETYSLSDARAEFGYLAVDQVADAKANAQSLIDGATLPDNVELTLVPVYDLNDSLQNIFDAPNEILYEKNGYTLTDEAGDLGELSREEAVLVQGAMNADDYQFEIADEDEDSGDNGNGDESDDDALTLEEALEAENGDGLPDDYTLASGEIELGALSVDAAEDALDDLEDIVEDAANADELTLEPSFTLKETLDNVLDVDDEVAEHMSGYELTDEPGDLGELSGEEAEVVAGASNADDYTFSREFEIDLDDDETVQLSATQGDDTFEFDDVDDIRDLEDEDDRDEDDDDDDDDDRDEEDRDERDEDDDAEGQDTAAVVIDGFGEEGHDTLKFSADDLNDLVEDATDSDAEPFTEGGQLTGDQLYVAAGASEAQTDLAAFVFDSETGKLSFDADGQGGHDAVEIATLNGVTDLTQEDFNIA